MTVNRNKRSAAIDLARPEGRDAFLRLAATADVVLEAYKGGVAERLGIDYPSVRAVNPRIIYCSLSAFGPAGPWKQKPGVDMLVQAMGGLMAITGEPDGGPVLCSVPVIDTMGALTAGQGIVTALLHRERTGEGQRLDVSLLNCLMLAQAARLPVFWATGEEPPGWGARIRSSRPSRPSWRRTRGSTWRCGRTTSGSRSARPSGGRSWPAIPALPPRDARATHRAELAGALVSRSSASARSPSG